MVKRHTTCELVRFQLLSTRKQFSNGSHIKHVVADRHQGIRSFNKAP